MNKMFPLIYMLIAFIWAEPLFIGEVLHYSAGFRLFPAGTAILSFESDSLDGNKTYLLILLVVSIISKVNIISGNLILIF